MTDRPDFHLSDDRRILIVRDWLALGMKNNDFQLHEIRRAIAMLLRQDDERRREEALTRRQH